MRAVIKLALNLDTMVFVEFHYSLQPLIIDDSKYLSTGILSICSANNASRHVRDKSGKQ